MSIPCLDDYQERFLANVASCIAANWLRKRPDIRILDSGCDTSGRQLWHIKKLTRGEVFGINIPEKFPTDEAVATAGAGTVLKRMDGMSLDFDNESFDMVISANVMEHVPDTGAYIRECSRVLKPGGIAYIETAPLWTSARGHHVMESMVTDACPDEENYRDDGSVIPDWSHLHLDESAMMEILGEKLLPGTCRYICDLLYRSEILNKTPWSVVRRQLTDAFPFIKISTWPVENATSNLRPTSYDDEYNAEDYDAYGFSIVGSKRKTSRILRSICWRLRRLGL